MALIAAATGIFGVISYSVSCRTHEIRIRVAAGASRGPILRMASREMLILAAGGLVFGGLAALVCLRICFSASLLPARFVALRLFLALSPQSRDSLPARLDPFLAPRNEQL